MVLRARVVVVLALSLTAVVLALSTSGTFFAQERVQENVSGFLVLEIAGELAKEYGELTGFIEGDEVPQSLYISTTAIIAQHLANGRIRIEHSAPVMRDGAPIQLVTLTATVDSKAIETTFIPAATPIYTSPAAHASGEKPVATDVKTKQLALKLSDLKDVKLRRWALATEIGG